MTPAGAGRDRFVETLRSGSPLAGPSSVVEGEWAAELSESPKSFLRRKGLPALSRSCLLAAAAVEDLLAALPAAEAEALGAGGGDAVDTSDVGLVVGTAWGHVQSKADFFSTACEDGVRFVSPIVFPNSIINSLAGHAAILFGLRGPNSTVTSGRRSGLEALLRARHLLAAGRARRVIVTACEEVSPTILRALRARGDLACDDPRGSNASIPFTTTRDGAYIGEASVAVILEEADGGDHPEDGAPVARLLGQGEATSVGRSLHDAATAALRGALDSSGVAAGELAWIALSGGGRTTEGDLDLVEAEVVNDVCGRDVRAAALSRVFGETWGASSLLSCAAALTSLDAYDTPFVPATPGAAGGLVDGISGEARALDASGPVLVSSIDPGGATAAVIGV